jgi:hypothetical protein
VRAAGLIETRPAWAYEIEITDIREIIANSPKTPLRTFTEGSFTLPTTGSQAHPCFTMNRTATASRNSRPPEQARRPASFRSGGRRSLLSRGVCQAPRLATPEARGFLGVGLAEGLRPHCPAANAKITSLKLRVAGASS